MGATLRYAGQLLHGGAARVVVTLYSVTTIRDIEQASQPRAANGPPAPDESSAEQPTAKRRRKQTNASKRRREEATGEQRPHSGTMHANMAGTNRRRWDELRRRFGRDRIQPDERVLGRTPPRATRASAGRRPPLRSGHARRHSDETGPHRSPMEREHHLGPRRLKPTPPSRPESRLTKNGCYQ